MNKYKYILKIKKFSQIANISLKVTDIQKHANLFISTVNRFINF